MDRGRRATTTLFLRATAPRRSLVACRQQTLSDLRDESHPGALQVWVELPRQWRAADFVARAAQRGVIVNPRGTFAVGGPTPLGIQIALGGARTRQELQHGLSVLVDLVGRGVPACVV